MHWYRATEPAASIDEYTVAEFDRLQCPYGRRVFGTSFAAQEHQNREEKVEDAVSYYLVLYWGATRAHPGGISVLPQDNCNRQ